MICVTIGRGRHRHMIAEHRHLVAQGAKLVELRLDYINGANQSEAALGRAALPGGHYLPPRNRRRQMERLAKKNARCSCGPPSSTASSTSIWKKTSPSRSAATARPSESSATTTSAKRPTTWRPFTPGWRRSMPTWSRWPRWPTARTTICGCCRWCSGDNSHGRHVHGRYRHAIANSVPAGLARHSRTPRFTTSGCSRRGSSASSR